MCIRSCSCVETLLNHTIATFLAAQKETKRTPFSDRTSLSLCNADPFTSHKTFWSGFVAVPVVAAFSQQIARDLQEFVVPTVPRSHSLVVIVNSIYRYSRYSVNCNVSHMFSC